MNIQQIFKTYAPEYLDRYKDKMPKNHLKVINAIIACRTAACGIIVYDCTGCGKTHIGFRSCGNRHCPVCQNQKTRQWLAKQLDRQLPGHHFMITFTVPEQLRPFIRKHQRKTYSALFAASSQTIKTFAADPKFVGGDLPGFFGVLHTWGRQLQYHPHIHYVVPGGALSKSDHTWHPSQIAFFAPVKAMSKIFRAKLRRQMKRLNLIDDIDPGVWNKGFNVNCQPVAQSQHSIRYLARYVFKVAISNSRIVKVENQKVFLRYKKPRTRRWRTLVLDVIEFMRRFLQHVLPTGFMKIRYYGFMSPGSSFSLKQVTFLIQMAFGFDLPAPAGEPVSFLMPTCPHCGATLKLRYWQTTGFFPISEYG